MADEHNCSLTNFEFDDVELRQPSPELAILTYTVTQDGECAGEALPEAVTSTAVYVRQEGEWKWASYQETPLE